VEEEEGEEQGVRVKERSFFLAKFLIFLFCQDNVLLSSCTEERRLLADSADRTRQGKVYVIGSLRTRSDIRKKARTTAFHRRSHGCLGSQSTTTASLTINSTMAVGTNGKQITYQWQKVFAARQVRCIM